MRNRILIAVFCLSALMGAFYASLLAHKNSTAQENLALFGTLRGFSPGAKVEYSILPEEGKNISGHAFADEQGTLSLPPYNMHAASGRYLSYALHINEGSDSPLEVTLTFDALKGTIALQGKGLQEFAEIGFKTPKAEERTRADWAGLVNMPEAGRLDDIGHEEGFKVALYDNNVMSDVPLRNPKIIEVLAAPGGGLYIDPLINVYIFPYGCNDGISPGPDYSFCDTGRMDAQIDNIVQNYVTALYMMGEQLSAVMAMQMLPVGAMIDAKQQLEAQRKLQQLTAEAHKDYHPSEMMCEFGTFVKSISTADEKSSYEKMAINDILTAHYTNANHMSSSEGKDSDIPSRLQQFREVYCDPQDNNDGLHYMCDHDQMDPGNAEGAASKARINKDIDYNKTLYTPLTLDLDFAYANDPPGTRTRAPTADEEDIIALAKNLYWPKVLEPGQERELQRSFSKYMNARQLYAMTNVAHNSFASLAGMKSKTGPSAGAGGAAIAGGGDYMKALMRDFGLSDADITALIGEYPSYYAQMEILTKKIYQRPDFYTNLYDKPANVKRIGVSLEAINLMQQRDFLESALRREMLTSLMVEQALQKHVEDINGRVVRDVRNLQHR